MYNDRMTMKTHQVLLCNSCGLRYPYVQGQSFGVRCPICMGETRVILSRELSLEPSPIRPDSFHRDPRSLAVLLDNIRSAWNAGSILRSADGFGVEHAYLCGITPTPENEAVTKTSLGAEEAVTWSYHKDAVKLVKGLKKEGWKVLALEEDERAVSINGVSGLDIGRGDPAPTRPPVRTVLIVGNEVAGVDPELLDMCDDIFYIPMRGEKKSFNVGIAFGIAAYALNQHRF